MRVGEGAEGEKPRGASLRDDGALIPLVAAILGPLSLGCGEQHLVFLCFRGRLATDCI